MDNCPLCGARLSWWDRSEPTRCRNCGGTINPPKLDPYRMTKAEKRRYAEGNW